MFENELVSIIMPTYNSEKIVCNSINSVLKQTYKNFELIIIDDASSDATIKMVNQFNDKRIKVLQQNVNSGAAYTRNAGIKQAKGRFLAFIDADDLWEEDKLEIQLKTMIKNKMAFTYTSYKRVDESGNSIGYIKVTKKISYKELLKNTIIGCSTVVIDRSMTGYFEMPLLRKGQDTATWLMLLKKIDNAFGIDKSLTTYTVRKGSISSNKFLALKRTWKIYREVENLSLIYSFYCFIFYIFNAINKRKNTKMV